MDNSVLVFPTVWRVVGTTLSIELTSSLACGPEYYVIRDRIKNTCLSIYGTWSLEPSQQEQSTQFIAEHRFDSIESARKAVNRLQAQ
ncbi:hypothetical protein [Vibrio barjaei]|uniref:hypothetical protein n=1 Tax=Vibrio barjaei TaxID=1676683 RepID=UPI0022843FEE|nr:hypothetical protein [Vibrio barjaei]MCY9870487.1 hypothetical protein [Vibrio barjaei]